MIDSGIAPSGDRAKAPFVRLEYSFRRALAASGVVLLTLTAALYVLDPPNPRTNHFFLSSDTPTLIAQAVLLLALAFAPSRPIACPHRALQRPTLVGLALAALVLVISLVGTTALFHDFSVVRDELDANFDAAIFRTGHLLAPLAPEWRPFIFAFRTPEFVLPVPGDIAWASPYLPVHAAMRALAGALVGAQWTNPILLGISVVALVAIARRLWPDRPAAALVAGLLLATSSQALLTAMTSYAMTAHLALNLVWLWLFLRNDRGSHAAAAFVGFLACGLHQLVFHPLFVAPFIAGLFLRRQYALFLFYVVAYAAACLFWIDYPAMAQWIEHIPPAAGVDAGAAFFFGKVRRLVEGIDVAALFVQTANLVRFLAWQNPIALPLAALSVYAIREDEGRSRELAAGLLLATLAFAFLMPVQGAGWGYRYLHGFLGSWCLLAASGWLAVMRRSTADQGGAAVASLALASVATCVVVIPFQIRQAAAEVDPYRAAMQLIEHAGADIVLVDRTHITHGELVRNDPDLRNRPVVMDLFYVDAPALERLCKRYRVALLSEQRALDLGVVYFKRDETVNAQRAQRLLELQSLSCVKQL